MIRKHIPRGMNKYNCTAAVRYHVDAQELLRIAQHKTSWKPSVAHQYHSITHSSRSQYATYGGRHQLLAPFK